MEKLTRDSLISENPTLNDFYNDMGKNNFTIYKMKDYYVIEMEKDVRRDDNDNKRARITIWKPQQFNDKYIPNPKKGDKYYWIGVARRYIDYDEDVPKTLANNQHHFRETIERYEYEGPREKLEFEIVRNYE
jgi:hypothetical protein